MLTPIQTRAFNDIWEQIAPDILQNESDILPRNQVIELVLDANRPQEFHPEIDWTEFNQLTYAKKCALLTTEVFKYETYGY
jgi:hypothetical protein